MYRYMNRSIFGSRPPVWMVPSAILPTPPLHRDHDLIPFSAVQHRSAEEEGSLLRNGSEEQLC